jgi:serine protease Do
MLLAGCVAVGIATAAWAAHSGALVAKPLPGKMMTERQAVWQPPTMDAVVVIMRPNGRGTGFSIGNGLIVTAAHVVDGARTVSIKDTDGNTRMAHVDIVDKSTDLAILSTSHRIPAAELDCRLAKVGDAIESIGTPLGLEFITATGRIAGTARKVGGTNVLVTDIVTVMGQSGGPVFSKGRVVGVTHAVMIAPLPMGGRLVPSIVGFGYIIPSSDVCALLMRSEGEGV